jgi:hypothetical protein
MLYKKFLIEGSKWDKALNEYFSLEKMHDVAISFISNPEEGLEKMMEFNPKFNKMWKFPNVDINSEGTYNLVYSTRNMNVKSEELPKKFKKFKILQKTVANVLNSEFIFSPVIAKVTDDVMKLNQEVQWNFYHFNWMDRKIEKENQRKLSFHFLTISILIIGSSHYSRKMSW